MSAAPSTCRLCGRDIPRGLTFCHRHQAMLEPRERNDLMSSSLTAEQRRVVADRAVARLSRAAEAVALERPSVPPPPATTPQGSAAAAFRRARELVAGIIHPPKKEPEPTGALRLEKEPRR